MPLLCHEDRSMWEYLHDVAFELRRLFWQMDRQQWIFVFVGALLLGFVCLRGFGSRTQY
jgi:hypothetical protein